MVIGISAVIDGNGGVQVTMGMRKLNTTLAQIKYIYVIRHGDQAEEVTRRRQKFFQSSAGHLANDEE